MYRFFTEHGIPLSIDNSEAIGIIYTSDVPRWLGTHSALIGVRACPSTGPARAMVVADL